MGLYPPSSAGSYEVARRLGLDDYGNFVWSLPSNGSRNCNVTSYVP